MEPAATDPQAGYRSSVVIPVFNQLGMTQHCLEALDRNTSSLQHHELIVVDNGSSDETPHLLLSETRRRGNLTVIRNAQNRGFALACNQGAALARAPYVVFLNNDTVVQPGWLNALLTILDADRSLAAAGSKLLYPNGTIQHTGILLVDDQMTKNPLHIWSYCGCGQFPRDHADVDQPLLFPAITAASMAVRKTTFNQAGGFDEGYWNGFEDIDLCLRLGQLGQRVIYVPQSEVVHYEHQSGAERFRRQSENQRRLREKWLGRIPVDAVRTVDGRLMLQPGRGPQRYAANA